MKKKLLKAAVIAVISVVAFNIIFPFLYTKLLFPNFPITEVSTRNGSLQLFGYSDFGYRYKDFSVYDEENDISIGVGFDMHILRPLYLPDGDAKGRYEFILNDKHSKAYFKEEISKRVQYLSDENFIVENPEMLGHHYGIHIYIPECDSETASELISNLNSYILAEDRKKDGYYISYSLNICMDDEVYSKIKSADFSRSDAASGGQAYFTDMLEKPLDCDITRLTASNEGFDEDIYNHKGDPGDDEYQSPENFQHLIFWYDSEPNSLPDSSHFYLFGINLK